ncbi:MAG: hypothetical protein ABI400_14090 [Lacisediminihabitans sp.]
MSSRIRVVDTVVTSRWIPGKSRFRTLALLALAVCVGVGIALFVHSMWPPSTGPAGASQTAVNVNGRPVPEREFQQFVANNRAATIGYFQEHFGANVDNGFWSRSFGEVTPREYLLRKAVHDATIFTVEIEEAEKLGVVTGFTYQGFLQGLKSENTQRAQDFAHGKVIYGPEQYSEADYFHTVSDGISSALEAKLQSTGAIVVAATTMHQYYESHLSDYPLSRTATMVAAPGAIPQAQPFDIVEAQVRQSCVHSAFNTWVSLDAHKAKVVENHAVMDAMVIS